MLSRSRMRLIAHIVRSPALSRANVRGAARRAPAALVLLIPLLARSAAVCAQTGYYAPIGACDTAGHASGVAVADNYAYVADTTALRIIDVTDPTAPAEVGHYAMTEALDVAVSGNYAYVADGTNGLWSFNISNPSSPVQVGHLATTSQAQPFLAKSIALKGSYALVGTYAQGTRFVSIANPAAPAEVALKYGPLWGTEVAVDGNNAYVADLYGNLWLYDVLNPADPQELIQWNFGGTGTYGVAAVGDWVYVSDSNALYAMYAPDPQHPSTGGYVTGACGRVKVANGYAYVAWELLSHPNGGLEVLDQSAPSDPVFGWWDTEGQSEDVAVANGRVYLADGDDGLVIFPRASPGAISGFVRVAGTATGIAGATVEARIGAVVKGSATTAANGSYSITGVRPGVYDVTASKQGYATQTKAGINVGVGQTVSGTNFGLSVSGVLTGQVRDKATGYALAQAVVTAVVGGVVKAATTADWNGIYRFAEIPPGTYAVTASKTGYISQTKANIIVTAGQTSYANFNLVRVSLKGQVKEAGTLANLANATVAAYQGDVLKGGATTNATGIYEIGGLGAGSYTVIASKAGYMRQTKLNINVADGSTTYVNFTLSLSGKLKGQVKDKVSGAPIIGATVVARMGGIVRGTATTTAPYGVYEIASDLPAGTYVVGASMTSHRAQIKKDVVVTAGATTYVNFNLQPE